MDERWGLGEEAVVEGVLAPVAQRRWRWGVMVEGASRALGAGAGVILFGLALQLLKAGAGGVAAVLDVLSVHGVAGFLGLGWLGSALLMSGSPMAAVAVSLTGAGTVSASEGLAMLSGSRMGASSSVLLLGFVLYLMRRRSADGLFIGVVALLVASTLWLPAVPLGLALARLPWLHPEALAVPAALTKGVSGFYGPLVQWGLEHLHHLLVFAGGVALLLLSFFVFDRALPQLDTEGLAARRLDSLTQRPWAMFLLGLAVTALTMSVSVSVGLLIPLSLRGYVRREMIVPYIMAANISTWVDTLAAAALVGSGEALGIVLAIMMAGSILTLGILLLSYRPYSRWVLRWARRVLESKRGFALFLAVYATAPLGLLLLGNP
jgi:sodium-dependent phosphate cotransporter